MLLNPVAVNPTPVADTVFLKDAAETSNIVVGATLSLTNMEANRISWEQGAYRTSNQSLYAVLGQCLAFCGELTIAEAKQRSSALEAFYKERGYKYKKELPLANRVVRAVFGDVNRRRISTYALVLRQAQKEGIAYSSLATWIEERGGIQEITLARSASYMSPSAKAGAAKQVMQGKTPIGFAKSDLLSMHADADFMGEACVLLAEQQPDGSFGVFAVLRQQGLVNAAYANLYAMQREATARIQKEVDAQNDADGAIPKQA